MESRNRIQNSKRYLVQLYSGSVPNSQYAVQLRFAISIPEDNINQVALRIRRPGEFLNVFNDIVRESLQVPISS